MAAAVYLLCAVTSITCAILSFRMSWRYRRQTTRLAVWSSLSLARFAVSNALVFVDFAVVGTVDLAVARAASACLAGGLLLFGLIWETA